MALQTYCENSIKAEITFSLTGGKEGKIISENPPISVFFGAADNYSYYNFFYNEATGEAEEKGIAINFSYPNAEYLKKYISGDKVTEYKVYQPYSAGSPGLIYVDNSTQEYINGAYEEILLKREK